jgi:hypothetical protein
MIYFAFVYPQILYGIEIYGNTNHTFLYKLEVLNNKILRILQNRPIRSHTIELYRNYDTLPLPLLHNYQILLFVHKFVHHIDKLPNVLKSYFTKNQFIHRYDTREKFSFHMIATRTTFGKRLIKYKGSQMWNNLPENLKSIRSTSEFKNHLRNFLLIHTQ